MSATINTIRTHLTEYLENKYPYGRHKGFRKSTVTKHVNDIMPIFSQRYDRNKEQMFTVASYNEKPADKNKNNKPIFSTEQKKHIRQSHMMNGFIQYFMLEQKYHFDLVQKELIRLSDNIKQNADETKRNADETRRNTDETKRQTDLMEKWMKNAEQREEKNQKELHEMREESKRNDEKRQRELLEIGQKNAKLFEKMFEKIERNEAQTAKIMSYLKIDP